MNENLTMTPDETANLFRDCGIRMDTETLREGIKQGAFNFGVAIKRDKWVYLIYRKRVMDYLTSIGAEVDDGQAV